MTNRPVLWYVHHHGSGHWRHALATACHLDLPILFASSRRPPAPLGRNRRWIELDEDLDPSPRAPTAAGRLHWAPLDHAGLLRRHRQLLDAVDRYRPTVAVVDVSVEIAVVLRVTGVPVISVRFPGHRDDDAHRLGFDLSQVVVAPVPARLDLVPPGPTTRHVGFVSGIEAIARPWRPGGPVVVMAGTGGSRLDDDVATALARRWPDRAVRLIGADQRGARWLEDPTPVLAAASVIVGNAGLGTVADALALSRPLVVVPEPRPFGEQSATAAALAVHALADVVDDPRDADALAAAVDAAERRGPTDRSLACGAPAFAQLVEHAAVGALAEAS